MSTLGMTRHAARAFGGFARLGFGLVLCVPMRLAIAVVASAAIFPQAVAGVSITKPKFGLGQKLVGDRIERVGVRIGPRELFELDMMRGIEAGFQKRLCCIALRTGFGQGCDRIGAEGKKLFLAFEAICETEELRALWRHIHMQPTAIRRLEGLFRRLQAFDLSIRKSHLWVSVWVSRMLRNALMHLDTHKNTRK